MPVHYIKNGKEWVRASAEKPCPICSGAKNCTMVPDGSAVYCGRVSEGSVETNEGGQHLHVLKGKSAGRRSSTGTERAPAAERHAVYSVLMQQLKLSTKHADQLRARGLSDKEIEQRQYRTLGVQGRSSLAVKLASKFTRERILRVPGFVLKQPEKGGRPYLTVAGAAGLVIPVRNAEGQIVGIKIRGDGTGGSRYTWMSSARYSGPGPESVAHVPLGITGPCEIVRLTEGPLKGDVAYVLSGIPTISVPGVNQWRACVPVLEALGAKKVILSFDADAVQNADVARALMQCAEALGGTADE